jgi:anti-sigma B factor antagonist
VRCNVGGDGRVLAGSLGEPMRWKTMSARVHGDVVIIDVAGNMCLCGEDELPAFVLDFVERGLLKFILNLQALPYVDSAGLSGLVRAHTTVVRRGGRLVLVHVQPRVLALLETTRLLSIIETFDSEDAALRSIGCSLLATR